MWLTVRFGIDSTTDIPRDQYDTICRAVLAPGPLQLEEHDSVREPRQKLHLVHSDGLDGLQQVTMSWLGFSRAAVFALAGAECVDAAEAWARRWKLGDALWLRKWAAFALVWWDVARRCTVPDCSHGCGAASADDDMQALAHALTLDTMRGLEAEDGNILSVSSHLDVKRDPTSGTIAIGGVELVPSGIRLVAAPLVGPHPLLETKDEFLRRAQTAWDEAVAKIAEQGLSVIVPRKLELHCEWLVRYHVCGETVAKIVKDLEKDLEKEDIHPTTISKAVGTMADMIDLPLRHSRDT